MDQSNSMDVDPISTPRVSRSQETPRHYTPSSLYATTQSYSSDLFVPSIVGFLHIFLTSVNTFYIKRLI